jgi:predicted GNAT family acetyltransferase
MSIEVVHDQKRHQFSAPVKGGEASLKYHAVDGALDLYSTYVPTEARGLKVAEQLLQAALEYVRAEKLKVIPSCSYVSVWFERHPEQKNLLKKP